MTTIADQNTDYPPPPTVTPEQVTLAHLRMLINQLVDDRINRHDEIVTLRREVEALRLRLYGKGGRRK